MSKFGSDPGGQMEQYVKPIRRILVKVIGVRDEDLHDDLDLVDQGLLDSLLALQILNALEREFDVFIPTEEVGSYVSVNTIAGGIERLRAQQADSSPGWASDDAESVDARVGT